MRVSCSKMSDTSTFLFVILHLLSIALIDDNAHARLEYQVLLLIINQFLPKQPHWRCRLKRRQTRIIGSRGGWTGTTSTSPTRRSDRIRIVSK